MPAGSAADGYAFVVAGNAEAQIGPIAYGAQGLYKYEIFQVVANPKAGYTYDRRIYGIEVYVDAALDVAVIAYNNGTGGKVAEIAFENSYTHVVIVEPGQTTTEKATTGATETSAPTTTEKKETAPTQETIKETTDAADPGEEKTDATTATQPPTEATIDEPASKTQPPTTDEASEAHQPATSIAPTDGEDMLEGDGNDTPIGVLIWDEDEKRWKVAKKPPNGGDSADGLATTAKENPKTGDGKAPPKTGDESDAPLYIALIAFGGMLIFAAVYLLAGGKRKRERRKERDDGHKT
jgi:hypothetical protein